MKICSQCGSQQDDDAVFCNKCGSSFTNAVIPPQQPQQQFNQPQQFSQQPQFSQSFVQPAFQGGAAAANTNSKKKLIIIISAIVALAVVVLILFLFVFKSNKDKLIGTWRVNGENTYLKFEKDGTINSKGRTAKYTVDGDQISITDNGRTYSYTIKKLTSDTLTLNLMGFEQSFTKVSDSEAEELIKEQNFSAKLKIANSNAKLVFTTVNNKAADIIADGGRVESLDTNGVVSVESFKDSTDPLKKAVYEALKENGEGLGYVYIRFDLDDDDAQNFAQWSETEDGDVIGQFPDPPKSEEEVEKVHFGTYYKK